MRALLGDLVTRLGGEARDEDGVLAVRLPAEGPGDELAKKLGQHELRLVFEATKIGAGVDLVAPGSHVLRAVEEFLAARGRRAWVEAPARHKLGLKALAGVARAVRGASLGLADRGTDAGHDVHVVYRVRYHSLERQDVLETVRVRLRPFAEPVVSFADPPEEAAGWAARPRKHLPPEELEAALALADQAVADHARVEGTRLEQDSRRRSARELSRLHAYYAGQIAELERSRRTELAAQRIEELEDERALRIHELAATTHVRVEVEPLQLMVVEVPVQTARLIVRRRDQEEEPAEPAEAPADAPPAAPAGAGAGLALAFDRLEGTLTLAPCPACDAPVTGGALVDACAGAHVVHAACLARCGRCQASVCDACGARACARCAQATCPACARTCPACESAVCPDHAAACAICNKPACAMCLHACAECGKVVCEQDGHVAVEGARAVLCTACATVCPGCKTATPYKELQRCGTCGRKFCPTCHPRGATACVLCAGARQG